MKSIRVYHHHCECDSKTIGDNLCQSPISNLQYPYARRHFHHVGVADGSTFLASVAWTPLFWIMDLVLLDPPEFETWHPCVKTSWEPTRRQWLGPRNREIRESRSSAGRKRVFSLLFITEPSQSLSRARPKLIIHNKRILIRRRRILVKGSSRYLPPWRRYPLGCGLESLPAAEAYEGLKAKDHQPL